MYTICQRLFIFNTGKIPKAKNYKNKNNNMIISFSRALVEWPLLASRLERKSYILNVEDSCTTVKSFYTIAQLPVYPNY